MLKIINIFFIFFIISFFLITYNYYSSNKNIESKEYNRKNINEIINTRISNLPILKNDTNNVIEFNDGFLIKLIIINQEVFGIYLSLNEKKAIIISIKGYKLSSKERLLLSKENPWGLILFQRNLKSLKQAQELIKNIKECTNDKKFPILIDEEGMKVSRLSHAYNHNINANFFGHLIEKDRDKGTQYIKLI